MTWIPLNVTAERHLLVSKFPQHVDEGRGWRRGLDDADVPAKGSPRAWVETSTGNLVLIETTGDPMGGHGEISARIWIAATDMLVDLPVLDSMFFGDASMHTGRERSEALQDAEARARDLLGLPA
ncbi:hypothetical protein ACH0AH_07850 [Microbacterium paludicola]|uniref:hypothetical protein n=1 Tax=Microbacterium paludicola TaxID=300019 RepID=UPI00387A2EEE